MPQPQPQPQPQPVQPSPPPTTNRLTDFGTGEEYFFAFCRVNGDFETPFAHDPLPSGGFLNAAATRGFDMERNGDTPPSPSLAPYPSPASLQFFQAEERKGGFPRAKIVPFSLVCGTSDETIEGFVVETTLLDFFFSLSL